MKNMEGMYLMQLFIQKNLKKLIAISLVIIGVVIFVSADEIIAKILPNASDLQMIYCELDKMTHEYTGQEIEPEIKEIAFQDKNGNTILVSGEEIQIASYIENIDIGKADIEVSVSRYSGTVLLEDVFRIIPETVQQVEAVQALEQEDKVTAVEVSWKEAKGADGYNIYRSSDDGMRFSMLQQITGGDVTTYQDSETEYNKIYQYKVSAFTISENETLYGNVSDAVTYYTPLITPNLVSAEKISYNSIELKWESVEGAVGYQVYRSTVQDGEFECIGEISENSVLAYTDSACDCGIEYFYYIRACQQIENKKIYGENSNVLSAKTTPDSVKISGDVSEDETQVTLSWKKSEGAQGYEIYKSEGYGFAYKLVQKIENADTLSWTDSDVSKDLEYCYKIRPYCVVNGSAITGEYSNEFIKEVVIIFNYTEEELSGNIAGITQFVGAQYVPGGRTPEGWDCSGFTQWALKHCFGVDIPKPAASQGVGGTSISLSDRSTWKPGDILAYSEGNGVSHVALYIGNGQLMHALNPKMDTIIQDVDFYEEWDGGNRLVAVKRYF